ncbi:hypothetical protein EON65_16725 [archaeon]|nr:MAG: hypothetical protein EON65_16725 [archaeon]
MGMILTRMLISSIDLKATIINLTIATTLKTTLFPIVAAHHLTSLMKTIIGAAANPEIKATVAIDSRKIDVRRTEIKVEP